MPSPELDALRKELLAADERIYERARDHAAKNAAQSITPIQRLIEEHDRILRGDGSDGNLGLVTQSRLNTQRLKTVEEAQGRIEGTLGDRLGELTEELRALTVPGRTQRKPVIESEPPPKSDRKPLVDRETMRWIIGGVLLIGGYKGADIAVDAARPEPAHAIQVQAEAVAEKRRETDAELQKAREMAAEAERAQAVAEQKARELAQREWDLARREQASPAVTQGP